jgi:hypothetical protein
VLDADLVARGQQQGPLDGVAKLAHVAGPAVGAQLGQGLGRQPRRRLPPGRRAQLLQEQPAQGRDLARARPQRRQ